MHDGIDLFRNEFQIFSHPDGSYALRFIGAPYTDDEANSIKIQGHNREPERLSAQGIDAILNKFGITHDDFKAAYNRFHSG